MKSEKCPNCSVTVFIDEGDQCPKECAKCGYIMNPNFVEKEVEVEEEIEKVEEKKPVHAHKGHK